MWRQMSHTFSFIKKIINWRYLIINPHIKPEAALNDLHQLVASHISEQEIVYMSELKDYLLDKSGSWSVGDEHLTMLAGFLANKDNSFAPNVPLLTLQILRGEY